MVYNEKQIREEVDRDTDYCANKYNPKRDTLPPIYVFTNPKGGVGKTNTLVEIASAYSVLSSIVKAHLRSKKHNYQIPTDIGYTLIIENDVNDPNLRTALRSLMPENTRIELTNFDLKKHPIKDIIYKTNQPDLSVVFGEKGYRMIRELHNPFEFTRGTRNSDFNSLIEKRLVQYANEKLASAIFLDTECSGRMDILSLMNLEGIIKTIVTVPENTTATDSHAFTTNIVQNKIEKKINKYLQEKYNEDPTKENKQKLRKIGKVINSIFENNKEDTPDFVRTKLGEMLSSGEIKEKIINMVAHNGENYRLITNKSKPSEHRSSVVWLGYKILKLDKDNTITDLGFLPNEPELVKKTVNSGKPLVFHQYDKKSPLYKQAKRSTLVNMAENIAYSMYFNKKMDVEVVPGEKITLGKTLDKNDAEILEQIAKNRLGGK